jgi:hypothetical protein
VAMPHPVLFFDEVGLTYDEYDKFIKAYPEAADIIVWLMQMIIHENKAELKGFLKINCKHCDKIVDIIPRLMV